MLRRRITIINEMLQEATSADCPAVCPACMHVVHMTSMKTTSAVVACAAGSPSYSNAAAHLWVAQARRRAPEEAEHTLHNSHNQ